MSSNKAYDKWLYSQQKQKALVKSGYHYNPQNEQYENGDNRLTFNQINKMTYSEINNK